MTDLEKAISELVAEHGFVSGWALVVATDDLVTDRTWYQLEMKDGQPHHHTLGLLSMGYELAVNPNED